jgi:hypothetical protein
MDNSFKDIQGTKGLYTSALPLPNIKWIKSNGKEATVNRALDGSTYPGQKQVHSVSGIINYGSLKHNSLYLGLVLQSGG